MSPICYALILSVAHPQEFPPENVQNLLKNRLHYQMTERNIPVSFDDSSCRILGTYTYENDMLHIESTDPKLDLKFPYNDILDGKKLDLSSLQQNAEKLSLVTLPEAAVAVSPDKNSSSFLKWLPWVAGTIGLGIGALYLYKQSHNSRSNSSNEEDVRRY